MNELDKLAFELIKIGVDYKEIDNARALQHQIIIRCKNGVKISCICHYGSYGYEEGLIELWDFEKEPVGYLTADEALKEIKKYL